MLALSAYMHCSRQHTPVQTGSAPYIGIGPIEHVRRPQALVERPADLTPRGKTARAAVLAGEFALAMDEQQHGLASIPTFLLHRRGYLFFNNTDAASSCAFDVFGVFASLRVW